MAGAFQNDAFQNDAFQVDSGSVSRTATDTTSLSDAATRAAIVHARTAADTTTISEAVAGGHVAIRTATDTVSSSDAVGSTRRWVRTATNTTSVSDAATRAAVSHHRIAIDTTPRPLATIGYGALVPVASFTYSPSSGAAPLHVQFLDTSTHNPTSWAWDFGDGGASTQQHPLHAFAPGSWTVSLTATNAAGSDTATV